MHGTSEGKKKDGRISHDAAGVRRGGQKLDYLRKVKREEIVQRIAEARSHGDLSENAEYDAARNEQAANERAIEELDYQIKNAVVIEESDDTSTVHFGSVVTVHDVDFNEDVQYTIMGTTEADPMKNIVSNESPVGLALIGKKKGDTVTVKAPNGEYKLKILNID